MACSKSVMVRKYVPLQHTGIECIVGTDSISIEDPWTGDVELLPFTQVAVSVTHPRFGRADPASDGLRTPLILTAQSSARASILNRECVLYSTLLVPEEVTQKSWSTIDRLLSALSSLGATIEKWRPPDDATEFDE
jgi:hypothetical protein